jgi:hypothetical protein
VFTHLGIGWDVHNLATEQFFLRQFPVAIAAILFLELGQRLGNRISVPRAVGNWPIAVRWAAYASFVMLVVMFGIYKKMQFIYFQF